MVVETRGKQHTATAANRIIFKSCFQDLQHFEQGNDQGNRIYGRLCDVWVAMFEEEHPDQLIPNSSSKKGLLLAGNIVETYKIIAEQVVAFDSNGERERPILDCIEAAKYQSEASTIATIW